MTDAEIIIELKRALRKVRRLNKQSRARGTYHTKIEEVCSSVEKKLKD